MRGLRRRKAMARHYEQLLEQLLKDAVEHNLTSPRQVEQWARERYGLKVTEALNRAFREIYGVRVVDYVATEATLQILQIAERPVTRYGEPCPNCGSDQRRIDLEPGTQEIVLRCPACDYRVAHHPEQTLPGLGDYRRLLRWWNTRHRRNPLKPLTSKRRSP